MVRALTYSLILLLGGLGGCGDPIGSPCEFQGSGFTASDNCRHRCLQHRTIHCPDGTEIKGPRVCSGPTQCDPGTCGEGEACYHTRDPFKKQSHCVQTSLCGDLAEGTVNQWEADSKQLSDGLIKEWEAKQQRRKQATTSEAPDVSPLD